MTSGEPDPSDFLQAYDDQLRRDAELVRARSVEEHGPLLWAEFSHGGFVTYRDLGGLEGAALDRVIEETVTHFRDDTEVASFEWKTRGHDLPADLGPRLGAAGLVAEDVETVMIGEASALAVDVRLPSDVVLRQAGEGGDLREDITAIHVMHDSVFGTGRGSSVESALADLDSGQVEMWLAEVGGEVVCAGRLAVVPDTEFAGIWGGSTLPAHRGRGIYRALVAARARSAVSRGVRYLHSDCTDMSRPILHRSGLVPVTTTTPYVWTRPLSSDG